jgi:hypothetical protein
MTHFERAIDARIAAGLRELTQMVHGVVPQNSINRESWTAKVRIPHPHGGIHPSTNGEPQYIELEDVPLPRGPAGIISALSDLVASVDRGCLVGFRGANLSFPYILEFTHIASDLQKDKMDTRVENRQPAQADRLSTAATPRPSVPLPPPPPVAPPSPTPPAPAAVQKLQDAGKQHHSTVLPQVTHVLNSLKSAVYRPKVSPAR